MGERGRSSAGWAVRRALRIYLSAFLILSAAGWLPEIAGRCGASWVDADYSALLHPSDSFGPPAAFADLTDFTGSMRSLSGTALTNLHAPFAYFPAAAYVLAFFLKLFAHPVAAYLVAFAIALAAMTAVLLRHVGPSSRGLALAAILLTLACGSPQIFTANRANLEWVNWALAVFAVIAFTRRRYAWTAILLGLAISVKPLPIVFFTLLLWRRRYVEAALGLATAAAVSLTALYALGPSVAAAAHDVGMGWADYFSRYVLTIRMAQEFRFSHSLLDAVKVPLWFLFDRQTYDPRELTAGAAGVPLWARLDLWAHADAAFAILAMAWIGWRFRRMPALNGIFALAIAEMLLPYGAAEYTMLLLYLPWGLLLATITVDAASGRCKLSAAEMLRVLVPCAVLFTPLSFMGVLTGFAKTALLIYLFVEVCRVQLPSSLLDDAASL